MRAAALACTVLLCATAHTESRPEPGILRARDLSPFGLQRLDMRPTDMSERPVGRWTLELQAAYQNTFAMSDDALDYLQRRQAGRLPLRTEDARALLAAPHDSYYVDVEVGVLDIILQRCFTRQLAAFFEIPYIHYGRGQLDALIENFHRSFGLSQMGRDLVARDRFQMVYRFADTRVQMLDREVTGGFGDPIVGVRYLPSLAGPWQFSIEAATKFPIAGERTLLSTGESDSGLQASIRRRFGRMTLQTSATVVYYSGGVESPSDEIIPTLILAGSYAATPTTSIILQTYASRSAVRGTTLDELNDNKYQLSLGLQSSVGDWTWTVAITENVVNYNNTPDVGFQLGLRHGGEH
jgi:hypothetical protein